MRSELLSIWPHNQQVRSLLDLGCRDCWWTAGLPGITRHVGVEIWPEALERGVAKAARGGIPHFEPVLGDVMYYLRRQLDASFDAVLAIDLLEHFVEGERAGVELLEQMARVAAKVAIAWTTLGLIDQGPYDVDGHPNPFEEHKWGPTPEWASSLGWQIRSYPLWHAERGGALLLWRYK